ncbi:MAG: hypothetical protein A2289_12300 [Deltaproteobacteria bacterium RIFOXYA12_FULL_58_15]|nr:MAG: hypothetical protein A2289_12300 [Deltaproteobacteria bacterium RIFOXYA12_FULL_58_15]
MASIRTIRFLPAIAWGALIFLLSSSAQLPAPPVSFDGLDKIVHAGVYGVLAITLLFAFGWPQGGRAWLCVILVALYGFTDEVHQSFVPHRHADFFDWVADSSGAILIVGGYLRRVAGVER